MDFEVCNLSIPSILTKSSLLLTVQPLACLTTINMPITRRGQEECLGRSLFALGVKPFVLMPCHGCDEVEGGWGFDGVCIIDRKVETTSRHCERWVD